MYRAKLAELSRLLKETLPDAEAVVIFDCLPWYSTDSGKQALELPDAQVREPLSRRVLEAKEQVLGAELSTTS